MDHKTMILIFAITLLTAIATPHCDANFFATYDLDEYEDLQDCTSFLAKSAHCFACCSAHGKAPQKSLSEKQNPMSKCACTSMADKNE